MSGFTTNFALEKPAQGVANWHTPINANLDTIDALVRSAGPFRAVAFVALNAYDLVGWRTTSEGIPYGTLVKADASLGIPAIGIVTAAVAATATATVYPVGAITNAAWTWSGAGKPLMLTTAGAMIELAATSLYSFNSRPAGQVVAFTMGTTSILMLPGVPFRSLFEISWPHSLLQFKDGTSNPAGSWVDSYETSPIRKSVKSVTVASGEDIDLVAAFVIQPGMINNPWSGGSTLPAFRLPIRTSVASKLIFSVEEVVVKDAGNATTSAPLPVSSTPADTNWANLDLTFADISTSLGAAALTIGQPNEKLHVRFRVVGTGASSAVAYVGTPTMMWPRLADRMFLEGA